MSIKRSYEYTTYEIFQESGHSTTIVYNGYSTNTATFDYTGIAVRETFGNHKKMISVSNLSSRNLKELVQKLHCINGDAVLSDTDQLIRMKKPILNSNSKQLFNEARRIVTGYGITICLSHAKHNTSVGLVHDLKTQTDKSHEFMQITFEDNNDPDISRYLLGFPANWDIANILAQMEYVRDWLLLRRKIKQPLAPGKYPLVFASGVGGILFHEVIGHSFELSKSHSIYSPIKYETGHRLCSDNLTVIDSPFSLNPTQNFDDEGTIKNETVLIKSGKIISPLTDQISSRKYTNYSLTGNSRRQSFLHYPEPRMYKTYVETGKDTVEQALSDIEYGFYVEHISRANCNFYEGNVFLNVSKAKLIRQGEITDIPATFCISCDMSEFLYVKCICDDLAFVPGICHSTSGSIYVEHGSPTLSFHCINIRNGFIY